MNLKSVTLKANKSDILPEEPVGKSVRFLLGGRAALDALVRHSSVASRGNARQCLTVLCPNPVRRRDQPLVPTLLC